jgi:hypothetical protein
MGMVKTFATMVVAATAIFVAGAMAQTQPSPPAQQTPPAAAEGRPTPGEEKMIEGQVRSVGPSNVLTELALKEPAASPFGGSSSPGRPSTAPPNQSPNRY